MPPWIPKAAIAERLTGSSCGSGNPVPQTLVPVSRRNAVHRIRDQRPGDEHVLLELSGCSHSGVPRGSLQIRAQDGPAPIVSTPVGLCCTSTNSKCGEASQCADHGGCCRKLLDVHRVTSFHVASACPRRVANGCGRPCPQPARDGQVMRSSTGCYRERSRSF